jgi:lambda repressor-like predicted transcriptional regulator
MDATQQDIQAEIRKRGMSYRALCRAVGLPAKDFALLAKVARGEHVTPRTLRRIGRALGVVPQPRKLHRPVVSEAEWREFQQWKEARNA